MSPEQHAAHRRQARNRALRRDGIVFVATMVALTLLWPQRLFANPDVPLAQELTASMDAVYADIRAGELELGTDPTDVADGIRGVRVDRPAGTRWVLAGPAGSDCYALWWDEEGTRRARTVPTNLACEPASQLTSPRYDTYDRIGRSVPEDDPVDPWALVLPDPLSYRVWFLPAVIIGAGIALSALVRMTIALLIDDAPGNVRR
jgi:hypothetical protein